MTSKVLYETLNCGNFHQIKDEYDISQENNSENICRLDKEIEEIDYQLNNLNKEKEKSNRPNKGKKEINSEINLGDYIHKYLILSSFNNLIISNNDINLKQNSIEENSLNFDEIIRDMQILYNLESQNNIFEFFGYIYSKDSLFIYSKIKNNKIKFNKEGFKPKYESRSKMVAQRLKYEFISNKDIFFLIILLDKKLISLLKMMEMNFIEIIIL
jgi:hypothetical protein